MYLHKLKGKSRSIPVLRVSIENQNQSSGLTYWCIDVIVPSSVVVPEYWITINYRHNQTCNPNIFFYIYIYFFGLRWRFPPLPWVFTVLHNDPAAPQDHCGRCRNRIRDLCLRSLAHYQWATTSPPMNHHISDQWATTSPYQWATTSPPMNHHISIPMSHHILPHFKTFVHRF